MRTGSGVTSFRQIAGDFVPYAPVTTQPQSDIEMGDVTGGGWADVVGLSGATVNVFRHTTTAAFVADPAYPTGRVAP